MSRSQKLAWMVTFAAAAIVDLANAQAPLLLVNGPQSDVELETLGPNQVVFRSDGTRQEFPFDQIVRWGSPQENRRQTEIVLGEGEVFVGELAAVQAGEIQIATELFGTVRFPRSSVSGILFRPPSDRLERSRLLRLAAANPRERERVLFLNGDEIDETILIEPNPANLPSTTALLGAMKTSVELDRLVAVLFRNELPEATDEEEMLGWIGLRNGSRLAVDSIEVSESKVELRLHGGIPVSANPAALMKEIVWIQPLSNQFDYLSKLQPAGYKQVPYLSKSWNLALDRNVLGGSLRCSDREYRYGVGMHSASRVAYDIHRRYRRLEATIAVDDAAGDLGSVIFRVFVDRVAPGKASAWEVAFESGVIRGGDLPLPIRVDVTECERIALVVDFADRTDECDYANWLDARLVQ